MKYDKRIRETGTSDKDINDSQTDSHPVDPHARDKFMAYLRGRSDGAGVRAMRDEFKDHPLLAESYSEGYGDGRKARTDAHVAASERFGVKLSVLRTPERIGESDG